MRECRPHGTRTTDPGDVSAERLTRADLPRPPWHHLGLGRAPERPRHRARGRTGARDVGGPGVSDDRAGRALEAPPTPRHHDRPGAGRRVTRPAQEGAQVVTHPQNQRDAIPDQGTPIGPVTPGTGATDLGKLWGATGSIGLSVGVLVFGYDPIGAQMLPIDVTNDGNDVGQLNLNPNTKLNVVPISGGGTPASNVIPGTLPGAAVLV